MTSSWKIRVLRWYPNFWPVIFKFDFHNSKFVFSKLCLERSIITVLVKVYEVLVIVFLFLYGFSCILFCISLWTPHQSSRKGCEQLLKSFEIWQRDSLSHNMRGRECGLWDWANLTCSVAFYTKSPDTLSSDGVWPVVMETVDTLRGLYCFVCLTVELKSSFLIWCLSRFSGSSSPD